MTQINGACEMTPDDRNVTVRECDIKHKSLNGTVSKFEERIEKLENRFWWIITLLVGNLVGVIIMLLRLR
jgi:hypothetical protein